MTESHRLWKTEKTPGRRLPLPRRTPPLDRPARERRLIDAANGGSSTSRICVDGRGDKVYASQSAPAKPYGVTRRGRDDRSRRAELLELARNSLDDPSSFQATPAVCNGRLLIRSDRFLYCIGN